MTEDTFAKRLASLVMRVEGTTADMNSDMNDIRQRLLALDALNADVGEVRAWAARLEQHCNELENRLMQLGVKDPALMDIADRLDALRHDMEEGT